MDLFKSHLLLHCISIVCRSCGSLSYAHFASAANENGQLYIFLPSILCVRRRDSPLNANNLQSDENGDFRNVMIYSTTVHNKLMCLQYVSVFATQLPYTHIIFIAPSRQHRKTLIKKSHIEQMDECFTLYKYVYFVSCTYMQKCVQVEWVVFP